MPNTCNHPSCSSRCRTQSQASARFSFQNPTLNVAKVHVIIHYNTIYSRLHVPLAASVVNTIKLLVDSHPQAFSTCVELPRFHLIAMHEAEANALQAVSPIRLARLRQSLPSLRKCHEHGLALISFGTGSSRAYPSLIMTSLRQQIS